VFCQLLMADEINRASPRTQSALLQAMQEQRVAIGGVEHSLPRPFHVLATQNPIEQEGTYPLPEAQLDRFLLEVNVTYPDVDAERTMLLATTGAQEARPAQAMSADDLAMAQALVRRLPIGEKVVDAILALVRGCRPESAGDEIVSRHVAWGPGPRAAQALMLATRARALLGGRLAPSIDDVAALARPVLRHRMALSFSARADGIMLADVIDRLVDKLG
jgi:MoxR-like ATPase